MRVVRLLDGSDEPEPLARYGTYEALILAAVADHTARRVDAYGNRGIGNETAAPDMQEQVVARDHPVPASHQMLDQVEHLRLHIHQCPVASQLATVGVKHAIGKG